IPPLLDPVRQRQAARQLLFPDAKRRTREEPGHGPRSNGRLSDPGAPGKGLLHMKHPSVLLGGLALAVFAFPAVQARADPITWTYDWSGSTDAVAAGGSGTGGVTFATLPA